MKKLAAVLVGVAVLATGAGFLLPSHWQVRRSITIDASPSAIYPLVASFKKGWIQWSPFGPASDPTMVLSYAGTEQGVGAVQRSQSTQHGDAVTTIIRADPAKGVEYSVSMDQGSSVILGAITFERTGKETHVTWTEDGDMGNNPCRRYVGLAMGLIIGKDLDQGLADLKKAAEGGKAPSAVASDLK